MYSLSSRERTHHRTGEIPGNISSAADVSTAGEKGETRASREQFRNFTRDLERSPIYRSACIARLFYPRLIGDSFDRARGSYRPYKLWGIPEQMRPPFRRFEDATQLIQTRCSPLAKLIFAQHCPHAAVSIQSLRHRTTSHVQ